MFYDYKYLLDAYKNIYCIVLQSRGKNKLVQSTGKNDSVHLSGKTEVRLKSKEQIKMSKKLKFRFTVTIEDSEVIYRNSYLTCTESFLRNFHCRKYPCPFKTQDRQQDTVYRCRRTVSERNEQ